MNASEISGAKVARGSNFLEKRAGGLGLGLHIVATIVSMRGGTIDAKSDGAGKRPTFTVTLPVGRGFV